MSAMGQKQTFARQTSISFTPKSRHVQCTGRCLLWANSEHAWPPGLILTYSLIFSANHSFCDVKHSDAASVRLRRAIDGPEVKPREKKKNEQTNDTGRNRICPAKFMVWSRTD